MDDNKPRICKIADCACTHDKCDRGWIEHEKDGTTYVAACKQCRPRLAWGLDQYGDDRDDLQDRLTVRNLKLADNAKNGKWRDYL
jgi:hypothetical protein